MHDRFITSTVLVNDFSSTQCPRSSECGCLIVLRSFSRWLAATPEEFAHRDNAQLGECAAVQWSIISFRRGNAKAFPSWYAYALVCLSLLGEEDIVSHVVHF